MSHDLDHDASGGEPEPPAKSMILIGNDQTDDEMADAFMAWIESRKAYYAALRADDESSPQP